MRAFSLAYVRPAAPSDAPSEQGVSAPPVEFAKRVRGPAANGIEYVESSTITADPYLAGVAYATSRGGDYSFVNRDQYVAKTIDGGITWFGPGAAPLPSLPLPFPTDPCPDPVALPDVELPSIGNLVVLSRSPHLPWGILVDVFVETPPQPGFLLANTNGPSTIRSTRSSMAA